jgi:hypothetical protein
VIGVGLTLQFDAQFPAGGLGAVGDELDGVDEALSAAAKLLDTLIGREVFELDVFEGAFALHLEGVELAGGDFRGAQRSAFLLFVAGGGGGAVCFGGEGVGGEVGALEGEFAGGSAGAACGEVEGGDLRNVETM